MVDVTDFFLWGGRVAWPGSPKNCELVFILFLALSVFACYIIVIELDFSLSLSVFVCYLIVMKLYRFLCVIVLLHYDGFSEVRKRTKKNRVLCMASFHSHAFSSFDKCNLG